MCMGLFLPAHYSITSILSLRYTTYCSTAAPRGGNFYWCKSSRFRLTTTIRMMSSSASESPLSTMTVLRTNTKNRMCNSFVNGTCKKGDKCPMSHDIDDQQPIFECHICSKVFTSKWGMNSHIKSHNAERIRYPCHLCPSTFGSKGDRSKHIKRHAGKQFKCTVEGCTSAFKSIPERTKHEGRVHGSQLPQNATVRQERTQIITQRSVPERGTVVIPTAASSGGKMATSVSVSSAPELQAFFLYNNVGGLQQRIREREIPQEPLFVHHDFHGTKEEPISLNSVGRKMNLEFIMGNA